MIHGVTPQSLIFDSPRRWKVPNLQQPLVGAGQGPLVSAGVGFSAGRHWAKALGSAGRQAVAGAGGRQRCPALGRHQRCRVLAGLAPLGADQRSVRTSVDRPRDPCVGLAKQHGTWTTTCRNGSLTPPAPPTHSNSAHIVVVKEALLLLNPQPTCRPSHQAAGRWGP